MPFSPTLPSWLRHLSSTSPQADLDGDESHEKLELAEVLLLGAGSADCAAPPPATRGHGPLAWLPSMRRDPPPLPPHCEGAAQAVAAALLPLLARAVTGAVKLLATVDVVRSRSTLPLLIPTSPHPPDFRSHLSPAIAPSNLSLSLSSHTRQSASSPE